MVLSSLAGLAGEGEVLSKSNVIFAEGAGHGGYWSIGYERKLYSFKYGKINVRSGASVRNVYDFRQEFNPDYIFPFTVSSQFGWNSNYLELGLNRTVSSISFFSPQDHQTKRMLSYSSGFYAGYKYDPVDEPISVRVFYSPITDFYSILNHWGGIAIGYAF